MAIKRPDIYEHNNPNFAISDSDYVKGGFRSAVADLAELYELSGKTGLPSAPGQMKEHSTIVYVSGETKYYILTDISNITNLNGWDVFNGGVAGTITGGTNGLSTTGTNIILGGELNNDTTININSHEFLITSSGGTPSLIGIDQTGILLSTSGSSVTMDSNEGFIYGSGYTSSNPNWIPTKLYVDGIAIGLNVEESVLVATTTNIVLSGLTTIDGIVTTVGDRVLVKNQTSGTTNGIYSANTGTWGRTSDYNFSPAGEIANGDLIPVVSGNTQYNSLWAQTAQNPITSGDTLTFTLFSMPTQFIGGTGINVNINTISVDGQSLAGNSIKWSGNTYNVDVTGGTLNTALNKKLNITTFTGYTATTQPILDAAFTGVTNVGGGSEVYSGTSGNTTLLRTIVGSGDTIVTTSGDTIIVYGSSGGSSQYIGESPSAVDLCGISIGYELTGKTVSCIIQDMLVPELFQTSVGTPSTSLGATFTGIQEIGYSASQTLTPLYSAGAITPLYCTDNGTTRGGAANDYSYAGPSISTGFFGQTSCVINPYTVVSGSQTWCVCTKYDEGACVKGSKGTVNSSYPTVCAQDSCTVNGIASVTGILPWYWGTNSNGTITSAIITGGTKTVANVGNSTPITYNATTEYLWFAAPAGTTFKTKWWVCAANAGNIGGTGELWAAACTVPVTSGQGCWSNCNFDVYVTCGITTTAVGISMCLYH